MSTNGRARRWALTGPGASTVTEEVLVAGMTSPVISRVLRSAIWWINRQMESLPLITRTPTVGSASPGITDGSPNGGFRQRCEGSEQQLSAGRRGQHDTSVRAGGRSIGARTGLHAGIRVITDNSTPNTGAIRRDHRRSNKSGTNSFTGALTILAAGIASGGARLVQPKHRAERGADESYIRHSSAIPSAADHQEQKVFFFS